MARFFMYYLIISDLSQVFLIFIMELMKLCGLMNLASIYQDFWFADDERLYLIAAESSAEQTC